MTYYWDGDGDGYGDPSIFIVATSPPVGYVANTDYDDNDPTTYPRAPEICDSKDNNNNGQIDEGCGPPPVTETVVSVASDGTLANRDSGLPSISADGRFVAFVSMAFNLVAGDTNFYADVSVHDRDADQDGVFDELGLGERATERVTSEQRLSRLARWVLDADAAHMRYGLRLPDAMIFIGSGTPHRDHCLTALSLCEG